MVGHLADAVRPTGLADLPPAFNLAQYPDDLLFRKPRLLHLVPLLGLYTRGDSHLEWPRKRGAGHTDPPPHVASVFKEDMRRTLDIRTRRPRSMFVASGRDWL